MLTATSCQHLAVQAPPPSPAAPQAGGAIECPQSPPLTMASLQHPQGSSPHPTICPPQWHTAASPWGDQHQPALPHLPPALPCSPALQPPRELLHSKSRAGLTRSNNEMQIIINICLIIIKARRWEAGEGNREKPTAAEMVSWPSSERHCRGPSSCQTELLAAVGAAHHDSSSELGQVLLRNAFEGDFWESPP